jgi:hypothetical protein
MLVFEKNLRLMSSMTYKLRHDVRRFSGIIQLKPEINDLIKLICIGWRAGVGEEKKTAGGVSNSLCSFYFSFSVTWSEWKFVLFITLSIANYERLEDTWQNRTGTNFVEESNQNESEEVFFCCPLDVAEIQVGWG